MKSIEDIKKLLDLVGKPGNIPEDAVAFALHLKRKSRQKKDKKFYAYAMNSSEIESLNDIILTMISTCKVDLRFQIAFSKCNATFNHWSFLEFNFRANDGNPELDILVCDPLGIDKTIVLVNFLSSVMRLGYLSKCCHLTVYIPTDILQTAGRACAYFVIDNIAMLSNQDDFVPVYNFMATHQDPIITKTTKELLTQFRTSVAICYNKEDLEDIYEFSMIISPLPFRLLRTKQNVTELIDQIAAGEQKEEIVNHKGLTLCKSVNKNVFFVSDRKGEMSLRNLRVNIKMEQLGEGMPDFTSEEDIEYFNKAVSEHRLQGLADLINHLTEESLHLSSTL